jgi:hypothetical protein
MSLNLSERLSRIHEQIAQSARRAGRNPSEIKLMAVSKTHPTSAIIEALAAGQFLFGENRVQEFESKSAELGPLRSKAKFHLIGHLQSNKAARAAELFDSIDTLDSLRLAERLNDAAAKHNKQLEVLLEIKLSPEPTKTGLDPEARETAELLEALPSLTNLRVTGLMTVPPLEEDPRTYFRRLRLIQQQWAAKHPSLSFHELSMGMSGDFEAAIEEGSTCIRLGTALFGQRSYPPATSQNLPPAGNSK